MPTLAANLSMMFTEVPFMERFRAAAEAGFRHVEYLFPYDFDVGEIAAALEENQLSQALFNCPPGDWEGGERGLACLPERQDDFDRSLDVAMRYAKALCVPKIHLMAGMGDANNSAQRSRYVANIAKAGAFFASEGVQLVIEPINGRDMPGYFLNDFDLASQIIDEIGLKHVALQFDFYHCQIIHGDLIRRYEALAHKVGHVQIAGVPLRHEPDVGEVHYPAIFEALDVSGYRGAVGCEYRPRAETAAGLGWARPYLRKS